MPLPSKATVIAMTSWIILDAFILFLMTDGRLFGFPAALGMPWLEVSGGHDPVTEAIWNICAFGAWGAIHSAVAQPSVQEFLSRKATAGFIPPQLIFMVFSALAAVLVEAVWQVPVTSDGKTTVASGLVLWDLNPYPKTWYPLPDMFPTFQVSSYDIMAVVINRIATAQLGKIMMYLTGRTREERGKDGVAFNKPKELVMTGWYGRVRHPLYSVFMLALVVTPRMDLGRLTVVLAFLVYLVPGVYFEEQRLEKEFGKAAYDGYRRQVATRFIPFIY